MMTPDDLMSYPSRATSDDALAALATIVDVVTDQDDAFAVALYDACWEGTIDFAFAYAHGANECDYYRDSDFTEDNNAFGIGHPDGASGGLVFPDVETGARFYVGELCLKMDLPVDWIEDEVASWPADVQDKWRSVQQIILDPTYPEDVSRIEHLNDRFGPNDREAVWMSDPNGPQAICDKGNRLFPNLADQEDGTVDTGEITFGRVPHPPVDIRDIANSTAWDNLGPRTIRAVVWHRMLGTLWGTDSYFRGEASDQSLTDYGLGVIAQDGNDDAGHLMRWNDPRGTRSPWASGPVNDPYGDGAAFVERYGTNAVNRDTTALEISGFETTPLDEPARDVIAGLTAYWADQYKVPWTDFPMVPGEDRSFVCWHEEFCYGTGKRCPFDLVKSETTALIDRTRDVLKQYQAGEPEEPQTIYPTKRVPVEVVSQGIELALTEDDHRYVCVHGGQFKTYPNREAPNGTPTPYARGQMGTFPYQTVVDNETWLVSEFGSWTLLKNWEAYGTEEANQAIASPEED